MSRVEVFQFPLPAEPIMVTIKDRARNGGLTSVRFLDDDRVVCCDFNEKTAYLATVADGQFHILDSHPTMVADGRAVQTDLMDLHGNRFAVSNFNQGSVSFYRIEDDKICFEREMNHNAFRNLHGLRFMPGHPDLMWITYCGSKNKCHQIIDITQDTVLHHFDMDQQCQDVAFVGEFAVVFARTNHIKVGTKKRPFWHPKSRMFVTAYVYRMPRDIRTEPPTYVRRWKGKGHLDACKEYDGRIYAANQYLDRVDVFTVSPDGVLSHDGAIEGMSMPHGVDIRHGRLAVTNYADSTLRLVQLQDTNAQSPVTSS